MHLKPNYFKKLSCSSSSFLITQGPKWQWSTQQTSSMSQMHGTILLNTPGQFVSVTLPSVSKNDDEKHCFLK